MTACTTVSKRTLIANEDVTDQVKRSKTTKGRQTTPAELEQPILKEDFFKEAFAEFKLHPQKVIARNTIVNVGVLPLVTDSDRANKVNHIFLNTIKSEHVKATNQAQSGRCWMFAGLNCWRHIVIKAFHLKNFEFSETYLYFFDKIERVDWYLKEIIKTRHLPLTTHLDSDNKVYDAYLHELVAHPITDGGFWNYFANLVEKYGLVPKQAMDETANSCYSEDMNTQLASLMREAAFRLRDPSITPDEMERIRQAAIKKATDLMIIFMGTPPQKFDWSYINAEYESTVITQLTPRLFKELILPGINLSEDFVVLSNYPYRDWGFDKNFQCKSANNMIGGKDFRMLNLPIEELKAAAMKSILKGMPVWFTGDVGRGFNPYKSALDEKLLDYEPVFGKEIAKLSKGQRLLYREGEPCHAMTLLGVNLDEKGKPISWQVENSWGYADPQEPGEDGFLTMSDEWFTENVYDVVIHKEMLSRRVSNLLKKEPVQLKWMDSAAH